MFGGGGFYPGSGGGRYGQASPYAQYDERDRLLDYLGGEPQPQDMMYPGGFPGGMGYPPGMPPGMPPNMPPDDFDPRGFPHGMPGGPEMPYPQQYGEYGMPPGGPGMPYPQQYGEYGMPPDNPHAPRKRTKKKRKSKKRSQQEMANEQQIPPEYFQMPNPRYSPGFDEESDAAVDNQDPPPYPDDYLTQIARENRIPGELKGGKAALLDASPHLKYERRTREITPEERQMRIKNLHKQAMLEMFIAGLGATTTNRLLTAPFERIKLLLQTQGELVNQGVLNNAYKGIQDCFRQTVSNEGYISLWRGVVPSILRYLPSQLSLYMFGKRIRTQFSSENPENTWKWYWQQLGSTSLLSAISSVFVYPLDYCRTRLACDVKADVLKQRKFLGMTDVLTETWTHEGIRGIYRGLLVCNACIFTHQAVYLGTYIPITYMLARYGYPTTSVQGHMLISLVSLNIALLASYPLDTIRRRMMLTTLHTVKYNHSFDAFKRICATEGWRALYRGALMNAFCGSFLAFLISASQNLD